MSETPQSHRTNNDVKMSFKEKLLWFSSIVGFVFSVIIIVEVRVDQKINNPKFLMGLASKVRPALIFDGNGSILADMCIFH